MKALALLFLLAGCGEMCFIVQGDAKVLVKVVKIQPGVVI